MNQNSNINMPRSGNEIPSYSDILAQHRPSHFNDDFSRKHPPMTMLNRAKIFAPFDALTGLGDAISRRCIITVPPDELSEDQKAILDQRMSILMDQVMSSGRNPKGESDAGKSRSLCPIITVTYFQEEDRVLSGDERAGNYYSITGALSKADPENGYIKIVEKTIPIRDIFSIEGNLFEQPQQ